MYVGGVLNCVVETLQACLIGDPPLPPEPPKNLLPFENLLLFYVGKSFHMGTFLGRSHKLKFITSTWEHGKGTSLIPC